MAKLGATWKGRRLGRAWRVTQLALLTTHSQPGEQPAALEGGGVALAGEPRGRGVAQEGGHCARPGMGHQRSGKFLLKQPGEPAHLHCLAWSPLV